ncbi:MAG: hypothetical protein JST30_03300 [Armatimonadetes bacterium]|nr:hypothetical protein [Armatimonadota bacterium]
MRKLLIGMFVVVAPVVQACMWDDDTLSAEAKGLPDVVDAIVGRTDVNPPEYYALRLKISLDRVAMDARDWEAYDNIAVSLDKLGRGGEGLVWLETKRQALTAANVQPTKDPMNDPWYRFRANKGTLLIHQWFAQGRPVDKSLIQKGLDELGLALKINPDAHFGRERVQIEVVKILSLEKPDALQTRSGDLWYKLVKKEGRDKVQQGLIGIMALGSGWDSPDLIALLASSTDMRDSHVRDLAMRRIKDLASAGRTQVIGKGAVDHLLAGYGPRDEDVLAKQYRALTDSARRYRDERTMYIHARVAEGRHPDNDPNFWSGYKAVERPNIKGLEPLVPTVWLQSHAIELVLGVAGLSIVTAIGLSIGKAVTRWKRL